MGLGYKSCVLSGIFMSMSPRLILEFRKTLQNSNQKNVACNLDKLKANKTSKQPCDLNMVRTCTALTQLKS